MGRKTFLAVPGFRAHLNIVRAPALHLTRLPPWSREEISMVMKKLLTHLRGIWK